MSPGMFQIVCLCVLLFGAVQTGRRLRKSGELPFRKYWPIYLVWAWCAGCFAYGIIFFIDAPLHENTSLQPCARGPFCGKTGLPHTQEEYDAFVAWQDTLIVSWLAAIPATIAARFSAKKK